MDRATGEAMEQGLREVCRSVRIGKILIQRVCQFRFYYPSYLTCIADYVMYI